MKIGIDLDDTITDFSAILIPYGQYYDYTMLNHKGLKNPYKYNTIDIFNWTTEEDENFWRKYLGEMDQVVPAKFCAGEVIKKLKDDGNEIIIITSRDVTQFDNPYEATQNLLKRLNIYYDDIIVAAKNKGQVCHDLNIDLLVDDVLDHCKEAINYHSKALLFDTITNRYDNDDNITRAFSWWEIYFIIKALNA